MKVLGVFFCKDPKCKVVLYSSQSKLKEQNRNNQMNRAGQAPQRPPNLGPSSNPQQQMGNAFRSPYNPSPNPGVGYSMGLGGLPRNAIPGVLQPYPNPGLPNPNSRPSQQPPGTSPGSMFSQRSAAGGFPFGMGMLGSGGSLPPHLQQQQQPQPLHSQQLPQQPPIGNPSSTTSTSAAPASGQPLSTSSGNGNGNGVGSSELNLTNEDFPALGSGNGSGNGNGNGNGSNNGTSSNGNGTGPGSTPALPSSYASQAGVGVAPPLTSGAGNGNGAGAIGQPTRDFGPEDFPALGGPVASESHGLNGFGVTESSRAAGNVAVGGLIARAGGFGGDSETRTQNQSWASPNPPPAQAHQPPSGIIQHPFSSVSLNGNSSHHPPLLSTTFPPIANANHASENSTSNSTNSTSGLPQTPAQQVLMSPADRWGLLGLLAMIRSSDAEATLLGIGTDLGTMGLDMQTQGNLYSTFITPWSDSSAAHLVEPDFHLPACYNVQPAALTPNKAAAFSDETLFFMFYAHPRDMLQEMAAQELWNRNWRFHKELRVWLTKETGTAPSQKQHGGETGMFTLWDPENWEKTRKRMHVTYSDLEEKTQAAFTGNVAAGSVQAQSQAQQQQGQTTTATGVPTQTQNPNQGQIQTRDSSAAPTSRFAGMGQGMTVGA